MTAQLDSEHGRDLLLGALGHDAVTDAVTELLFEHVVGGRYERSELATLLRAKVQDALHAATGEDREAIVGVLHAASEEEWRAVTDQLIAQAREIDGEGRLGFYDLHRQRYAEVNPIREAGEFQIGDYGKGGALGEGGEFKVTLIELGNGGRWGLFPHLEVFGDGKAALREAIDIGILDVLDPVDSREEFARRLIAIGIVDRSDTPLCGERDAAAPGAS
jgi:hypothetical protein